MVPREGADLTLQEAADRLGVHYMTVYRYVRTGRLPARRDGAGWLVREADVLAFGEKAPPSPGGRGRSDWNRTSRRLMDRLVDGDEAGAWAILEAALGGGAAPVDLYVHLLAPALRTIGDRWEDGSLTMADEHRATAVASRLVGRLGPRFVRRGRRRGTVVIGVAPDDHHALPAAMLGDVLRGEGFRVVELGGATPVESFLDASKEAGPLLAIGLSVGTQEKLAEAASVLEVLRTELPGTPLLLGGPAVTDNASALALGADAWASDANGAAELVKALRDGER